MTAGGADLGAVLVEVGVAQDGLVPLDGQQVARAALVQVFGVGMLGMEGIGGDDGIGDFDAVQQRREQRDFVGLDIHIGLAQDQAMSMIERREQVSAAPAAVPGPA